MQEKVVMEQPYTNIIGYFRRKFSCKYFGNPFGLKLSESQSTQVFNLKKVFGSNSIGEL